MTVFDSCPSVAMESRIHAELQKNGHSPHMEFEHTNGV